MCEGPACVRDQTRHFGIASHHPRDVAAEDKGIVAGVGVEEAELTLIYVIVV